jgi:3-deoxy-manno-octulosonate cytidylyltransferase (CMP-KDO synthetase)
MNCIGIIPARFASTRFPGKPLTIIDGISMIQRVYTQVSSANSIAAVMVATDDERIFNHVKDFGGNVYMTAVNHNSGTDRCAEVLEQLNDNSIDVVINIQGDEPYIQASQIDLLASCFTDQSIEIATLIKKIDLTEDVLNPNVVKVIKDINNKAIYFSRSAIPFQRGVAQDDCMINKADYYKHIGIYAYRPDILSNIVKLPLSSLEKAESLEQLRWIENGYAVYTAVTKFESIAIDTPEDLNKLSRHK